MGSFVGSVCTVRRRYLSCRGRVSPIDALALSVCVLVVIIAVIGPWIAPYDPYSVDLAGALHPPSWSHPMGTDSNGRDVASRVLAGARITLSATAIVLAITCVIGVTVGTLSALCGRYIDEILMRITDIGLAVPSLVLGLGFAVAMGPGITSTVIAIAATWWPGYARLVRASINDIRSSGYIESSIALGVGSWRLAIRHILPNALGIMYIQVTLDVAAVMLVISGLSFVGVGAQVPSAEWGAMIAGAANNIENGWWALVFPGAVMAITAIAFSLSGDWLRVRRDPTLRTGVR
ncbi:MAG: ABC transporter permease [Gordonia sp. (in: high G+C Gram-positive bacteria)]